MTITLRAIAESLLTKASRLARTIRVTIVAISLMPLGIGNSGWGHRLSARWAILQARSAMRSRSLLTFIMVVTRLRSAATGWCNASIFRQSSSIRTSALSTSESRRTTSLAKIPCRSINDLTAKAIMSSTIPESFSSETRATSKSCFKCNDIFLYQPWKY